MSVFCALCFREFLSRGSDIEIIGGSGESCAPPRPPGDGRLRVAESRLRADFGGGGYAHAVDGAAFSSALGETKFNYFVNRLLFLRNNAIIGVLLMRPQTRGGAAQR